MLVDPAVLYAVPAKRVCREICEEIVAEIRSGPETPVRTGELRGSYHVVDTPTGAGIDSSADYWHYVEFGTHEMDAEPHVRPAIEVVRKRHLR